MAITYKELTAKAQMKIYELEEELVDLKERLEAIRLEIVCIGGPLNDNKLGYNKEQLKQFRRILENAEID